MTDLRLAAIDGAEKAVAKAEVDRFAARLRGDLPRPGDGGYDVARRVWNAMVDNRPAAFPHRYDHYDLLVHPATDDPADYGKMIGWARECWQALQPFVERAVYVNALEDALEEGEHRVREAYGPNHDRLVALKRKYDPTNLFRLNSNIRPEAVAV